MSVLIFNFNQLWRSPKESGCLKKSLAISPNWMVVPPHKQQQSHQPAEATWSPGCLRTTSPVEFRTMQLQVTTSQGGQTMSTCGLGMCPTQIFGLVFIFHLSSQFLNWSSLRTVFRLQQSSSTCSHRSFEIADKSERQTIVMMQSQGVGILMLKKENYDEGDKEKRNNRKKALPSKSKQPSCHSLKTLKIEKVKSRQTFYPRLPTPMISPFTRPCNLQQPHPTYAMKSYDLVGRQQGKLVLYIGDL